MIAEFHNRLGDPQRQSCTRLVVYDSKENIIACFLELADGTEDVRIIGQPGFEQALTHLGVRQTAVVETIHREDLKPLHFDST